MRRLLWLVGIMAVPVQAAPAEVVASAPVASAITIYHGDNAAQDMPELPAFLGGYALIRETRQISLPAGTAVVRFPGVAAGMMAESVVFSGLPGTVSERNLDAALISPKSFYAGWYGRPVSISRTDAQGRERIERAVIRSGPDGAAVIETARGFEVVNCGPFTDSLRFPSTPPGLFPTPTLSVEMTTPTAVTATVTLTYLAWNFDWRADYTLALSPDWHHGTLQAWLTLASTDATGFAHADAAVVAGKPSFDEHRGDPDLSRDDALRFQCRPVAPPPSPVVMAPAPVMMDMAVPPPPMMVTAMRAKAMVAEVESVADLKLYRLPVPTTVAANAAKQVMLIAPRQVTLDALHVAPLDDGPGQATARLELRAPNRAVAGLGIALPGGRVRVMVPRGDTMLPLGTATLADRAVGERVRWTLGADSSVRIERRQLRRAGQTFAMVATVRNAGAHPVSFEGTFRQVPQSAVHVAGIPLPLDEDHPVWRVTVPARGSATLRYSIVQPD